jgi:toxin ParE1/3/4
MARKVVWAESAFLDLENAAEYISNDSPTYAAVLVSGAESSARSLAELPERGRRVPEYHDPNTREVFVGSYRLIYQVSVERVNIIAFIHGSRDLGALLAQ